MAERVRLAALPVEEAVVERHLFFEPELADAIPAYAAGLDDPAVVPLGYWRSLIEARQMSGS